MPKSLVKWKTKKGKEIDQCTEYLDEFRRKVVNSEEPLKRATRLATADNAVDFGPKKEAKY